MCGLLQTVFQGTDNFKAVNAEKERRVGVYRCENDGNAIIKRRDFIVL